MIDTNTVFILGAGASVAYGYPTGKKLRHDIITHSKDRLDALIHSNSSVPYELRSVYENEISQFIKDFKKSATPSIELFLSRNKHYEKIGKLSIATNIFHAEANSKFVEDINPEYNDWYSFLIDRMSQRLPTHDGYKNFKDNQVSFITFNYDRSFDYFIHESLIHSFIELKGRESDVAEFLPFPIIHVYGVISKLPWQEKYRYEYKMGKGHISMKDFDMIYSMSKNIRIIQERVSDTEIEKARELIANSKRIFFLGFGFAEENLKVLDIPNILSGQSIFGTVRGYRNQEIMRTFNKLLKTEPTQWKMKAPIYEGGNITLADLDCLDLLKEFL